MKLHSEEFKNEIKLMGKQQDIKIIYDDTILGTEEINSIDATYEGNLLKSVMKQLEIDSNIEIPKGQEFNFQYGLLVNDQYEYLDYGNYIVYSVEKQEDTNSYLITCYDKLLYSMKDYEDMKISYPTTVRDYINSICNYLGLTFADATTEFVNYDKTIPNELYLTTDGGDMGYTFRDVLDELAQVTASGICLNRYDQLEIRYPINTDDTIDEEYLKDVNVNFGEKYGPINSVVLSRSGESDNIYYRDEQSIATNGLCEIKIIDNQIMNFNNRDEFLPEIFNKLKTIEYYLNDYTSTGIMYYDFLDAYNVKIGENTYNCIMLNDEQNITQGLEELIYTQEPEISETDYTKADKTDRKINQAYIIVDKQNQQITALTENVGQYDNRIAIVEQTVDEINQKVSNVQDFTRKKEAYDSIYLDDIAEEEGYVLKFIIYGSTEEFNSKEFILCTSTEPKGFGSNVYLTTEDNQDILTEDGQQIIVGTGAYYIRQDTIILDDILRSLTINENTYYDTLEISQDGTTQVVRRIGIDSDGNLYLLNNPIVETLPNNIILPSKRDGIYYFIEEFNNIKYSIKYIIQNDYSDTFITKIESESAIKIAKNEIELSVNEKTSTDELIAKINLKPGQILLEGTVTANENFKILEDGSIEAKNGSFSGNIYLDNGGKVIGGDGIYTNLQFLGTGTGFQGGASGGFNLVGYYDYYDGTALKTYLDFYVDIPEGFVIDKAYITMIHQPVNWTYMTSASSEGTVNGYCRSLQIYESDIDSLADGSWGGEWGETNPSLTVIQGALDSEWTPSSSQSETKISNDISSILKTAGFHRIIIRSTQDVSYSNNEYTRQKNFASVTGRLCAILNIYGYMTTK